MTKVNSAALRFGNGIIYSKPPPARHPSLILGAQAMGIDLIGHIQGFVLSNGEFVTREEAFKVAKKAGQLVRSEPLEDGRLYTEDLW